MSLYKIGDISKRTGVSVRSLRYYDKIGLLHPSQKKPNGYRYYNDADKQILEKIIIMQTVSSGKKSLDSTIMSPPILSNNIPDMVNKVYYGGALMPEPIYSDTQIKQLARSHGISVEEIKKHLNVPHVDSHSKNIFVFIELYYPIEDRTKDVLTIAQESSEFLAETNGLIQFMVLEPTEKGGPVSNISLWRSKEDFNTFTKSEELRTLYSSDMMKNIRRLTTGINVMKFNFKEGWHSMHG